MRLTKAELEAELAHTRKIRDEIREQRDRWEASANASAKAASDNAALANRYLAELEALKRGEFICLRCGLRKDSDPPSTDPQF